MLKRIFNIKEEKHAIAAAAPVSDPHKQTLLQAIQIAEHDLAEFNKRERANNKAYQELQKQIFTLKEYIAKLPDNSLAERFKKKLEELQKQSDSLVNTVQQSLEQDTTRIKFELTEAKDCLNALVGDSEENVLLRPILQQQIEALTKELESLTQKHRDTAEEEILVRISTGKKTLIKYLADKVAVDLKLNYLKKLDEELQEIKSRGIEPILVRQGFESPLLYDNNAQSTLRNMMKVCAQQLSNGLFDNIKARFIESYTVNYESFYNNIDENAAENFVTEETRKLIEGLVAQSEQELDQQKNVVLEPIKRFIKKAKAIKDLQDNIQALDKGVENANNYLIDPKFSELNNDPLFIRNVNLSKKSFEAIKKLCQLILTLDLYRYDEITPIFNECEKIIQTLQGSYFKLETLSQSLSELESDDISREALEIEVEICKYLIKSKEIQLKIKISLLRTNFVSDPSKQEAYASNALDYRIDQISNFATTFLRGKIKPSDKYSERSMADECTLSDQALETSHITAYEDYIKHLQEYYDFLKALDQETSSTIIKSKALLLTVKIYYSYACIPNEDHKEDEYKQYLEAYEYAVKKYQIFHNQLDANQELRPEAETLFIIRLMLNIFQKPSVVQVFPSIIDELIEKISQPEHVDLKVEAEVEEGEVEESKAEPIVNEETSLSKVEEVEVESGITEVAVKPIINENITAQPNPRQALLQQITSRNTGSNFKQKLLEHMSESQRVLFLSGAPNISGASLKSPVLVAVNNPAPKTPQLDMFAALRNRLDSRRLQLADEDDEHTPEQQRSPSPEFI